MNLSEILSTAIKASELAGQVMTEYRNNASFEVNFKGLRDLVTTADLESEKIIMEHISARYPEHLFLTEESSPSLDNEYFFSAPCWIIDPIDGTTNFAQGLKHTAVSIAFMDKGEVLVAVVFAPFQNELFTAIKGEGAKRNDVAIHVNDVSVFSQALIATGFPTKRDDLPFILGRLQNVLSECRDVRRFGAASLDCCYVAAGLLDGYYEDVQPWDIAAGSLIIREAGGQIGCSAPDAINPRLPNDLQPKGFVGAAPGILAELLSRLRPPE